MEIGRVPNLFLRRKAFTVYSIRHASEDFARAGLPTINNRNYMDKYKITPRSPHRRHWREAPRNVEEAWHLYGPPRYVRRNIEHLKGYEEYKKWQPFIKTQIGNVRSDPIYPPFKEINREAGGEISEEKYAMPRPKNEDFRIGTVDPTYLVRSVQEKIDVGSPLLDPNFFKTDELVTVEGLFDSRCHFGHKMGTLNPFMRNYMYGERMGICIFNLDKTLSNFRLALTFVANMAFRRGTILFVSRHREHQTYVEKAAMEAGEFSNCRNWIEGFFTRKLQRNHAPNPDCIVIFSSKGSQLDEHPVVLDAAKVNIPIVGIVDSNVDPRLITYPIPGNDDSLISLQYYLEAFKQAIMNGKAKRAELFNEEPLRSFPLPALEASNADDESSTATNEDGSNDDDANDGTNDENNGTNDDANVGTNDVNNDGKDR